MKFTVEINCDTPAFHDGDLRVEVSEILHSTIHYLRTTTDTSGELHNILGDQVGTWRFIP